jgi:hypothetical protein
MPDLTPPDSLRFPEAAVLLVLLPAPVSRAGRSSEAVSPAALDALQLQLGAAIRVLRINESSHPSVVSSFKAAALPCFVLVHHGIELWRQCGLTDGGLIAPLLLSKISPAASVN